MNASARIAADMAATEPPAEECAIELLVSLDRAPTASPEPRLEYGTVATDSPSLAVEISARTRAARRAKSCLVAPESGDRVLCSVDGDHVFVLAILEGSKDTTLVSDGDLTLRAGGTLELSADAFAMKARTAFLAVEELRAFGRELDATFGGKVGLFAERLETRATTLLQRAKQAYRFVEGLDQTRSGAIDLRAEGLASMRGETTIMAARVLAKLDGEQVKIG